MNVFMYINCTFNCLRLYLAANFLLVKTTNQQYHNALTNPCRFILSPSIQSHVVCSTKTVGSKKNYTKCGGVFINNATLPKNSSALMLSINLKICKDKLLNNVENEIQRFFLIFF